MAEGSQITVGGGRYELLEKLGKGEFGVVHRGIDLDEGVDVAVKLFKAGVKIESALAEAQLQRRLSDHPRVVGLRNVDVRTGPGPIVVTVYMPAGSVQKRIGEQAAGLRLGLRWTIDAADALTHAHANGVFHRDAKPSNLLLDETEHASLCDFGVAEDNFVEPSGNPVYPTLTAPEQAQTGTTERTEVWMLGTLLYRLVLGEYPYPLGSVPPTAAVDPQARDPQIPAALAQIMRRALSPDPATRYTTVAELREALLGVRVVTELRPAPMPPALHRWEASIPGAKVIVEVIRSPHATFTARLRVDRGSGPRTVCEDPRRPGERGALRDARTFLHAVVEGRLP